MTKYPFHSLFVHLCVYILMSTVFFFMSTPYLIPSPTTAVPPDRKSHSRLISLPSVESPTSLAHTFVKTLSPRTSATSPSSEGL